MLVSSEQRESVIIIYTHPPYSVSLPPPIPPLQEVTELHAGLPVLYNGFPLVIYFTHDSVYMVRARIDAFKLWCWKTALWTARRSNQSILKEISPEYSLQGLMLKLKLQCFGHLMERADSLKKTLTLGKTAGKRKRGKQRMKWLDSITDSIGMNLSKLWETAKDRGDWHAAVHRVTMGQTRLSDCTTAKCIYVNATFSIHATLSFPCYVPKSVLYICISIPSL